MTLGYLLWDGTMAGAGRRQHFSPGPATSAHSAPPGPPEAAGRRENRPDQLGLALAAPTRGPPPLPSTPCHEELRGLCLHGAQGCDPEQ